MDTALFLWLNRESANPLYDAIMPFITKGWVVRVVLIGLGLLILARGELSGEGSLRDRSRRAVAAALLAVVVGELLVSDVIKPLVGRPRPPVTLGDEARLLVHLGRSYSFPSAHAFNSTAVAVVVSQAFPRRQVMLPLLAFAAAVSYSRVYVGVHYPLDIVAGAMIGVGLGVLAWRLVLRWWPGVPAVGSD